MARAKAINRGEGGDGTKVGWWENNIHGVGRRELSQCQPTYAACASSYRSSDATAPNQPTVLTDAASSIAIGSLAAYVGAGDFIGVGLACRYDVDQVGIRWDGVGAVGAATATICVFETPCNNTKQNRTTCVRQRQRAKGRTGRHNVAADTDCLHHCNGCVGHC